MTIEEKAKAYDEAKLRMSAAYNSNRCTIGFMNEIFPELKEHIESENEKIRKWLIALIKSNEYGSISNVGEMPCPKLNVLAWLEKQGNLMKALQTSNAEIGELIEKNYYLKEQVEKQGEQKSVTMSLDEAIEHCKEKSCGNNACALEHKQLERWLTELKELKEQKPAWSEEDEKILKATINTVLISRNSCEEDDEVKDKYDDELRWLKSLKNRVQPQVEWSEEDEEIVEALNNYVKNLDVLFSEIKIGNKDILSKEFRGKVQSWLKSLKDRVQSKQEWKQENICDLTDFENTMIHIGESFFGKNAGLDPNDTNMIKEQANLLLELVPNKEWSEEDSYMLRQAIKCVNNSGKLDVSTEEIEYWLKSIRLQKWKPTEEQIKALDIAIRCGINPSTWEGDALRSLLEQLKQL